MTSDILRGANRIVLGLGAVFSSFSISLEHAVGGDVAMLTHAGPFLMTTLVVVFAEYANDKAAEEAEEAEEVTTV